MHLARLKTSENAIHRALLIPRDEADEELRRKRLTGLFSLWIIALPSIRAIKARSVIVKDPYLLEIFAEPSDLNRPHLINIL